jgi:hypothetical protein
VKTDTLEANGVRLRPFVANRKLPSARDLEMAALRAQQPVLSTQYLSGQVSSNYAPETSALPPAYAGLVPTAAYPAPQPVFNDPESPNPFSPSSYSSALSGLPVRAAARMSARKPVLRQAQMARGPRVGQPVPANIPTFASAPQQMPIPVNQVAAVSPAAVLPTVFPPQTPQSAQDWLNQQNSANGEQALSQSGALLVQAPVLAPNDQAVLDRLAELTNQQDMSSLKSNIMGQQIGEDPGPAPFPLNLLPQDSLMQLMRRGGTHTHAPRVSFGSWHQGAGGQVLPQAGFRTYMGSRGFSTGRIVQPQSQPRLMRRTQAAKPKPRPVASNIEAARPQNIATYPPYSAVSGGPAY